MNEKYKSLFEHFTFKSGVNIKNRLFMAPMTNFSSDDKGMVTDEELAYYKVRSGGVGAVITAVAYVTPGGKGFINEISAASDQMIPSLKQLANTIKGEGAKAILQIFHAGRMAPPDLLPDNQPTSASAVAPLRPGAVVPRELSAQEIESIIEDFAEATRRAIEAGFDGVEIHGANTYLIQQFFSPHSNRRSDQWGGTLDKRMKFPIAVIDAVKKSVAKHANKPFIVGYRLSPEEAENPGITMEDTLVFADKLSQQGLDYLHISVQDFWQGSIRDDDDKQSRILKIHERIGNRIPIIGVGSLYSAEDVKSAKATGVPLIALGRELIVDPKWVQKLEEGNEHKIDTTLTKNDQERLVVPDQLWQAIINRPGWFPVVEK
ncbi:NADH-dependent flavin oxidoreductase [Amphibacillus cookii]|uniref:NADH-dependent flavin oxidoreductase n=1 Tax=Amphibacillus cookii TaxID=767787 RepID=UPI001959BFE1|nr:NADH-dependent flavin oxidoreductase [Amphibacillus cookii]MBM7541958.1 2,4-dienoyl-CoA reductase-like NADH-dependent reductase (Old Yellow Enzyme family) [Amphibacillus cookii]